MAPGGALRVGRVRFTDGLLRTTLSLPGAGTVGQRVTISTAAGKVVVGRVPAAVAASGDLTLSCRLSAYLRERLRLRWLRLSVVTTFRPTSGLPESATRDKKLPRSLK